MTLEKDYGLLICYLTGFTDELDGLPQRKLTGDMQRAYNIGRSDALVGDDVSSVDLQTDEDVLSRIKENGV